MAKLPAEATPIHVEPTSVEVAQTGGESASGQPGSLQTKTEKSGVTDVRPAAEAVADAIIKHLGD